MSEEDERLADEKARQAKLEADFAQYRIGELHEKPIKGNFDAEHLKAIHAHIFQDFPQHRPGIVRGDVEMGWVKHRTLEGVPGFYNVPYETKDVESKIADTLDRFGGSDALQG